jgi:hypothetical protein
LKTYILSGDDWVEGQPAQGQKFKKTNAKGYELISYFSAQTAPDIAIIRKVSKRAFMQRMTFAERTAIRKSTDDVVIDIREDLNAISHVDLDLADTLKSLSYLASVDILKASRINEILADGKQGEI